MTKFEKGMQWLIGLGFLSILIAIILFITNESSSSDKTANSIITFLLGGVAAVILGWVLSLFSRDAWENQDSKSVDKSIQMFNGVCPKCFKKISRLARKCPHCTADL